MARLTLRTRGGVFWAQLPTAMPTIAEIIAAKKAPLHSHRQPHHPLPITT